MKNKINLVAVSVAGFVSFFLGFIWYTVVFRQPYLDGLGKTNEELAKGPNMLEASMMQLVASLVMAYVLAWILERLNVNKATHGAKIAVLLWFGFVASVIVPLYAFQAFSLSFTLINIGYPLVTLIVMGGILGIWKRN